MKQDLIALTHELLFPRREVVKCSLCKNDTPAKTAHAHQGEFIGECCWDERLKASE